MNKTVTKLGLNMNSIGDDGAKAIAEALEVNKTVTKLGLNRNFVYTAAPRFVPFFSFVRPNSSSKGKPLKDHSASYKAPQSHTRYSPPKLKLSSPTVEVSATPGRGLLITPGTAL